jgi:hypothetical protein
MFSCIYCFQSEPTVKPSETHVFPDAMGGVSSSNNTVCGDCNTKTNRSFEQFEVEKFAFFQSIWGITNRRGNVAGVKATVTHGGKTTNVSLDERGIPKSPLVVKTTDAQGKNFYDVCGPEPLVHKKQQEIEKRIPDIHWTEKEITDAALPQSVIEIASDLGRSTLRRLAAKVAYERWGQLRDPGLLNDRQFEELRSFIMAGEEATRLCGIITDRKITDRMLRLPVGYHAVFIFAHPTSSVLGSFVVFYGLFFYWVILSRRFEALAVFDEALIEDPQHQTTYQPTLRNNTGGLLINWSEVARSYVSDPARTATEALKYAAGKFQSASTAQGIARNVQHVLAPAPERE